MIQLPPALPGFAPGLWAVAAWASQAALAQPGGIRRERAHGQVGQGPFSQVRNTCRQSTSRLHEHPVYSSFESREILDSTICARPSVSPVAGR